MKVFISWSGSLSQKIAEELKKWLQQCIQSLDIFYSKNDIEKGEFWPARISEELKDTHFGIICLTKENINAPWIHFESGALSKMVDSRVATVVIGANIADIKGPLNNFQSTKLEKDDMYKLLLSINSSMEKPLDEAILKTSFDAFWNNFFEKITNIIKNANEKEDIKNPKINVPDALEEILQIVRNQNSILNSISKLDLEETLNRFIISRKVIDNDVDYIISQLFEYTQYILDISQKNNNINDFLEEYLTFIRHLVRDYPIWRRKFTRLLDKMKYRVDEKNS